MSLSFWQKLTGWKECPTCNIPVKIVAGTMFDKFSRKHDHQLTPLMRDRFNIRGRGGVILEDEDEPNFIDSYVYDIGLSLPIVEVLTETVPDTSIPDVSVATPNTPSVEFGGGGGFDGSGGGSNWGSDNSSSDSSDSSYDSGGSSYDSGGSSDSGGGDSGGGGGD